MAVSQPAFQGIVRSGGTAINYAAIYFTQPIGSPNAWNEITASTAANLNITSVGLSTSSSGQTYDLSTGAAGAETVVATIYGYSGSQTRHWVFTTPLRIPSGTRLAVRANGGSINSDNYFSVHYCLESQVS